MFFLLRGLLIFSFTLLSWGGENSTGSSEMMGNSSLILSQVRKSKVPVFSSEDGYVCFFLRADEVGPAKRKVGIFSVPKHGLAVENMSLDFRRSLATADDWSKILRLIESYLEMELIGQLKVFLPDVPEGYNGAKMPRIYKNKLYVPLANHTDHVLVMGHSPKENKFYWKLKSPESFAYEF